MTRLERPSAVPLIVKQFCVHRPELAYAEIRGHLGYLLGDDAHEAMVGTALYNLSDGHMWKIPVELFHANLSTWSALLEALVHVGYATIAEGELVNSCDVYDALDDELVPMSTRLQTVKRMCTQAASKFLDDELSHRPPEITMDHMNLAAYVKPSIADEPEPLESVRRMLHPDSSDPSYADVPKNRRWRRRFCRRRVMRAWLSPCCQERPGFGGESVVIRLSSDPLEQLQMPNNHGTCMRLSGAKEDRRLLFGYVTDINKRMAIMRKADGTLMGRQMYAISKAGLHSGLSFPYGHPQVDMLFRKYTNHLQRLLGLEHTDSLAPDGLTAPAHDDWVP